ncbi:hypothetical protein [Runella slithyformis]|uniref:Uncharacterized protein n=1 Tax=Runella slithyformis (strain ATCC 29530 / DSM 19594 / LMG 11500 / NCIMB 11436 / LSU 4) TaxID=761193 RepID=A0A7U4E6Y6_RUNSL|nr:hypothetical protein [Runella slithyformis]AEI49753.1 hypothetical protein Runsl_3387 [Runella slithyformis DSM 19594]
MELTLINGRFETAGAKALLEALAAVKINYHQNCIQHQHNEEDIKMSENRIKTIERELKLALAYCSGSETIDLMATLSILNVPMQESHN